MNYNSNWYQESLRGDSRQGSRGLSGSGIGTPLGAPPRALAIRPPSLTSSSTGTSSKVELAQRHWYAIATVLLVAGAAGVAVPLALRVSAGASLDERLELAAALLASSPLIDGHNDLPWNIRKFLHNKLKDFRFSEDLRNIPPWSTSPWSHTDLPRLKQGLISAQFWAAYVPCAAQHKDAVQLVLEQIDVVRRLTDRYNPDLVLCTTPKDIKLAHAAGRVCSLVGVEGGHALGGSLGVLRALYALGVRYLTLTSTCDTPWAQCALADAMGTGAADHDGLAPFGRLIIKEMNRLGMIVDLSHVSQSTMRAALNATEAPILFSHSSAHALCNSSRNVPDSILKRVAENRGLVMVNFYSQFLTCKSTATVADAIAHINHIRDVAGIDSVGLGAGYDGINFTPKGLEDVSTYPLLFAELLAAGWSTEELKKLAGLNFLRVFEEVERVRDEQAQIPPYEEVMQPRPAAAYNCTSQDLF
ncbi:dipeptidase 1-like [Arctopsyche grandis]|uniref:dipeptidase 1-like n=1 Tax=Arctopsyche grandis TaxID=121162 RepID=UPI00406D7079